MNRMKTVFIYEDGKAEIPTSRVEKPPVESVEKEWQTASKTGIFPSASRIASVIVSTT